MKIVVTGSDGFVGKYLVELLKKERKNKVFGLDRAQADITDYKQVKKYLAKIRPDQVYHLAGFASGAGKDRELIFSVNVDGTLNILKALKETCLAGRRVGRPIKILLASTAYVYGNTSRCVEENGKIDAKSFYDQSKIKMEKEALKYQDENIQIVITRATNHTGPGQKLGFVVPDFCEQITKTKSGDEIMVGNLSAKRDIFDVRDCVRAYKIVMNKGKAGEVYNIGTGRAVSIKEILEKLIKISGSPRFGEAGKKISYQLDPKRMRPSDIKKNCVNANKLRKLGWEPKISLEKTLEGTYRFYNQGSHSE